VFYFRYQTCLCFTKYSTVSYLHQNFNFKTNISSRTSSNSNFENKLKTKMVLYSVKICVQQSDCTLQSCDNNSNNNWQWWFWAILLLFYYICCLFNDINHNWSHKINSASLLLLFAFRQSDSLCYYDQTFMLLRLHKLSPQNVIVKME